MAGVEGLESVLFAWIEKRAEAVRSPTMNSYLMTGKIHVNNDEHKSSRYAS
jgi:hypothetical protein